MSGKKKLLEVKKDGLTYDAGVMLGKLAASLRAGRLICESEEHPVNIDLPVEISLEMSIKEKSKNGGIKRKIEIELEWVEVAGE